MRFAIHFLSALDLILFGELFREVALAMVTTRTTPSALKLTPSRMNLAAAAMPVGASLNTSAAPEYAPLRSPLIGQCQHFQEAKLLAGQVFDALGPGGLSQTPAGFGASAEQQMRTVFGFLAAIAAAKPKTLAAFAAVREQSNDGEFPEPLLRQVEHDWPMPFLSAALIGRRGGGNR
jgi:hypothetical protein